MRTNPCLHAPSIGSPRTSSSVRGSTNPKPRLHAPSIASPRGVRGSRALIARPPERVDEIMGPPAPVIPIARLRRPRSSDKPGAKR